MLPGETVLSGCKLATEEDFQVLQSAAGFYIGTFDDEGPITRETGYFASREQTEEALALFKKSGYMRRQRGFNGY